MDIKEIEAALGADNDIKALHTAITGHIKGLKDNNQALITEKRELSDQLKQFDGVDVTAMQKQIADYEAGNENGKSEIQRLADQVTALQESITTERESAAKARGETASKYAENELIRAIEANNGISGALLNNLKPLVKGVDNNGSPMVQIVGSDGKARFDESGNPMTAEGLLKEIANDSSYAWGFKPSGLSGAGASNSNGGAGGAKTVTRDAFDQMDQSSRSTFIKDGGGVVD